MATTWQRQAHALLENQAAAAIVLACGLEYGEETSAVVTIQKRLTRLPNTHRNINENMN